MPIFKIILLFSFLLAFINIIASKKLDILSLFLTLVCLFELVISKYNAMVYGDNRLSYLLFSYLCVCFYFVYFKSTEKKQIWNYIYYSLFIIWQIYAVYSFLNPSPRDVFNCNIYNLGMIFTCIIVLKWLYHKLYIDSFQAIFENPKLYVGFGILFFYTCSFTILNYINPLVILNDSGSIYNSLLKIGNIFLSLGYLIAISWKTRHTLINL